MSDAAPAISVIVTSHDHERYVEASLDGLTRQTFTNFEVIVIDDFSHDGSVERIRDWLDRTDLEARLIVNPQNLGVCATLNLGLSESRGELVSHLSADDVYEPEKLERQYLAFEASPPSVAVVYSDVVAMDPDGTVRPARRGSLEHRPEGHVFDDLVRSSSFIATPAVMMRRSAVEAVGGFDEALVVEDIDMWLRLAERFEFRYCPGTLVRYRVLPESASHDPAKKPGIVNATVMMLDKWRGRSPQLDAALDARLDRSLDRVWRQARRLLASDPATARLVLRSVYHARPTPGRRLFLAASRLPGAPRAAGVAIWIRDRFRSARNPRRSDAGFGTTPAHRPGSQR